MAGGKAADLRQQPYGWDHMRAGRKDVRRCGIEEDAMSEPLIDWTQCSIVEMVPGRLSGAPVLKNTRLPVDAILNNYDAGLDSDQVAKLFDVPVSDVRMILEFREQQVAHPS
jgi:uncharacterized protein (DUF433 family)